MSSSRPSKQDVELKLDWCSHKAARWAIREWYYRDTMPIGKLLKIGVWEDGQFSGVLIFGLGASDALGRRWGLGTFECCELVRIALKPDHKSQISRVIKVALIMLRRHSPGVRAVVSFADPAFHHGGVYQAGGWIYTGTTAPDRQYRDKDGNIHHSRNVKERGWDRTIGGAIVKTVKPSECEVIRIPGKHRYVMGLDEQTRAKIAKHARPAPNAASRADEA